MTAAVMGHRGWPAPGTSASCCLCWTLAPRPRPCCSPGTLAANSTSTTLPKVSQLVTLGPWASGLPEVNAGSQLETGCGNTEKAGVRPGSWVSSGPWRMVGVGPGPELGLKLLALALRGKEQRPRARRRSRARGWTARPRGIPQLLDVGCWGGRRLRGGAGKTCPHVAAGCLGVSPCRQTEAREGPYPRRGAPPLVSGRRRPLSRSPG